MYVDARDHSTNLIASVKIAFFRDSLETADNNTIFNSVKSLVGYQQRLLPDFDSAEEGRCDVYLRPSFGIKFGNCDRK